MKDQKEIHCEVIYPGDPSVGLGSYNVDVNLGILEDDKDDYAPEEWEEIRKKIIDLYTFISNDQPCSAVFPWEYEEEPEPEMCESEMNCENCGLLGHKCDGSVSGNLHSYCCSEWTAEIKP